MGRRSCPADRIARANPAGSLAKKSSAPTPETKLDPNAARAKHFGALALALAFAFAATLIAVGSAAAQTLAERPAAAAPAQAEKMFVEAAELRYNTEKDTVSAEGNARVYYRGRVLEADRVTYDRRTGRVYAEGHAKLTETNGTVLVADRFDLTDDFRDGFIESLRADTKEKTHFSAARAERIEGDTTVFDRGAYTACEACKDNPDRPPLWRVRAKRIIHKNDEKMIYYEDASLELLGIPVAYVPFFSTPDPSVKRKSGILSPHLVYKSALGSGLGIPIFWALAPNYDFTFTPTYFSQQGFLASGEWRHRLDNGEYYIRANGIAQQHRSDFSRPPFGAGDQTFRGDFETKGLFYIADYWKFGWEFTLLSDKWFLNDYHVPNQTRSSNYFSETTSTAYLIGQGDRGYFDLRGYYFEGLSSHDFQPQQPLAHPVWDYNKTIDIDPASTFGIGGQVELDFNLTSLSAASASFQSVGTQVLDNAYGLYNICANYVPGQNTGSCILRGVGGEFTRATLEASWKRKFIDPIGEVWTPFAFARFNGEWLNLNTTNTYSFSSAYGASTYTNFSQLNFVGNKDTSFFGEIVPAAGLDYRYPFFASLGFGSAVFEPIAQIILRPDTPIGKHSLVNLDAQSLVFDDSTLFVWSKYSGYDRFETGTRANYGAQLSLNFDNGGYASFLAGQSYQVAGTNSYAIPDAANVGLSSGLDTRRSDYVTAFSFAPSSMLSFTAKSRFDVNSLEPRRVDLIGSYNLGAWTGGVQYANYQAQPVIGYYVRREGLSLSSRYKISDNYFAQGNITFDMSRQFYPPSLIGPNNPGPFAIAAYGLGGGYQDDCTTFSVNYSSIYQDNGNGALVRNETVLLQLQLRTLGDAKVRQTFTTTTALDGVKY
jgi:LPS-assembly protein